MANLWKIMWSSAWVSCGKGVENSVENIASKVLCPAFVLKNVDLAEKLMWFVNKNLASCGNNKQGYFSYFSTKSEVST